MEFFPSALVMTQVLIARKQPRSRTATQPREAPPGHSFDFAFGPFGVRRARSKFNFAPLLHARKTEPVDNTIAYGRTTGLLESGHTLTGIVGSNPTLSAISFAGEGALP